LPPGIRKRFNYEDLCLNPPRVPASLQDFLGISQPISELATKLESLKKKDGLKADEIFDVRRHVLAYFSK